MVDKEEMQLIYKNPAVETTILQELYTVHDCNHEKTEVK